MLTVGITPSNNPHGVGKILATILTGGTTPSNNPHKVGKFLATTPTLPTRDLLFQEDIHSSGTSHLAFSTQYSTITPPQSTTSSFSLGTSLGRKASRAQLQPALQLACSWGQPPGASLYLGNAYWPPVGCSASARSIRSL